MEATTTSHNSARIRFVSGTSTATGAHFILEDKECMIGIDCGLLQGEAFADEVNLTPFPYDVSKLNFLLVTHAHIDHVGRIPKLVREGFRGEIISTPETKELARLMLEDAERVMVEEAKAAGRDILWTREDMERAFELWSTLPYREKRQLGSGFSLILRDAGHILGSAMCEISRGGRKIVFTGDLGNSPTPLLKDTEPLHGVHYLVMESVYGDRNHEGVEERRMRLKDIVSDTMRRKGTLLIPSFSLEKTQVLLHELNILIEEGSLPPIPVFLDSPLAQKVTSVYSRLSSEFNEAAKERIQSGDDLFSFPKLAMTRTAEESKRIAGEPNPKIIIAGSGMSTGGRILHHEKHFLPDPTTTILFVGYQVPGSLGREIQEGAKKVTVDGSVISIKAKIETVIGYSSHKDSEHLLQFVEASSEHLEKVFVVLGEPKSSLFLVQRIRDYLDVDAVHPKNGDSIEIEL